MPAAAIQRHVAAAIRNSAGSVVDFVVLHILVAAVPPHPFALEEAFADSHTLVADEMPALVGVLAHRAGIAAAAASEVPAAVSSAVLLQLLARMKIATRLSKSL